MIDLPSQDPLFLPFAVLAALTIGLSKGGLPAVAILSVPILSLFISPVAAVAVTLPIYVASDVLGLYLYRRHFSGRNLAILVPAGIAGIAVGWATFSILSDRVVVLIVGTFGIVFCVSSWLKRRVGPPRPADLPRGVVFGVMAGFTSFIANAGAPPFQMYVIPQRLEKLVFAGTSTILFAVFNAVKLLPYWQLGQFSGDSLGLAALLCPAAFLGTVLGIRLLRVIPQDLFYHLVRGALFLVSLRLVYDGLRG